ncbi:unnamed protein product [Notodromas monacha]|uniref:Uncharacterized protein n=1 Tax=Notodromas monacha TaxID=399045 RepID=A0A7R9GB07_9CRUS|nr:unnamed protein product [Notodromas monacha]CAG0916020.1 unnamed protein product [Notodromas monacha]
MSISITAFPRGSGSEAYGDALAQGPDISNYGGDTAEQTDAGEASDAGGLDAAEEPAEDAPDEAAAAAADPDGTEADTEG